MKPSVPKVWFVLSLLVFSFLYGVGVGTREWFPHSFLRQAHSQAQSIMRVASGRPSTFVGSPKYDRQGVRRPQPAKMQPGVTLISSSWKGSDGWNPELRLMNEDGEVLHRWRINRSALFQEGVAQRNEPTKVHGALLLSGGEIVVNVEYVGMVRLNSCSDVLWTLPEGNHHSISQDEDGSFWVPGVYRTPRAGSERYPNGFPGLKGKKVWVDRIMQVSQEGTVLTDIPVLDVLYENGLERYIPRMLGGSMPSPKDLGTDITHLNDIEPLSSSMAEEYPLFEAGDLLVSLRSLSLVFVFNPETLEVKWHSSDPFIYQHDPDFIGNGWIGVFDNNFDFTRGEMLGGSRILFLNPETDSVHVAFPTQFSEPFYTSTQGKWQHLDNGNMLLTEARPGRVVEVDSEGRTVWEWIHAPIDESTIPRVTKASRYDLTRDEIASWPCSSADSLGGSSDS